MEKGKKHDSHVYKGLLGLLVAFGIVTIVLLGVSLAGTEGSENMGACNDYDPCTSNHIGIGSTCVTPPQRRKNGYDCTNEDRCYLQPLAHGSPSSHHHHDDDDGPIKQCQDGRCISDRRRCNGYCYNDTHCNTWPLPLRVIAMNGTATVDTFCFAQSCITLVVGGYTGDCMSWIDIDNPRHNHKNQYIAKCLYMRFDDFGGTFPPGVCYYRYLCAPFDFRPPYIPASVLNYRGKRGETVTETAVGPLSMSFGPEPLHPDAHSVIANRISDAVNRFNQAH